MRTMLSASHVYERGAWLCVGKTQWGGKGDGWKSGAGKRKQLLVRTSAGAPPLDHTSCRSNSSPSPFLIMSSKPSSSVLNRAHRFFRNVSSACHTTVRHGGRFRFEGTSTSVNIFKAFMSYFAVRWCFTSAIAPSCPTRAAATTPRCQFWPCLTSGEFLRDLETARATPF